MISLRLQLALVQGFCRQYRVETHGSPGTNLWQAYTERMACQELVLRKRR